MTDPSSRQGERPLTKKTANVLITTRCGHESQSQRPDGRTDRLTSKVTLTLDAGRETTAVADIRVLEVLLSERIWTVISLGVCSV